jgi:hypothetical protein
VESEEWKVEGGGPSKDRREAKRHFVYRS